MYLRLGKSDGYELERRILTKTVKVAPAMPSTKENIARIAVDVFAEWLKKHEAPKTALIAGDMDTFHERYSRDRHITRE